MLERHCVLYCHALTRRERWHPGPRLLAAMSRPSEATPSGCGGDPETSLWLVSYDPHALHPGRLRFPRILARSNQPQLPCSKVIRHGDPPTMHRHVHNLALPTPIPHMSRSQAPDCHHEEPSNSPQRPGGIRLLHIIPLPPVLRNLSARRPPLSPSPSDPKGDHAIEPPLDAGERFRVGPVPVRFLSKEVQAAGSSRATRALP